MEQFCRSGLFPRRSLPPLRSHERLAREPAGEFYSSREKFFCARDQFNFTDRSRALARSHTDN